MNLSFGTQKGFSYTVEYKASLADSAWTPLSTVAGDGAVKQIGDSMAATARFFRLVVH